MSDIKLEEWFDVSKKIGKDDLDLAIAQMALYAYKDGADPDSPEACAQYDSMRQAVKQHNKRIRIALVPG